MIFFSLVSISIGKIYYKRYASDYVVCISNSSHWCHICCNGFCLHLAGTLLFTLQVTVLNNHVGRVITTFYIYGVQVLNQDETPLLYSLVFGEGVVNDATSVVLFNAIQSFDLNHIDPRIALQFIGNFFYLFFASTVLGVLVSPPTPPKWAHALTCICRQTPTNPKSPVSLYSY